MNSKYEELYAAVWSLKLRIKLLELTESEESLKDILMDNIKQQVDAINERINFCLDKLEGDNNDEE